VIEIYEPAGRAWCNVCEAEVMIHSRLDACPHCASYPLKVVSGGALRVMDLVVVDD